MKNILYRGVLFLSVFILGVLFNSHQAFAAAPTITNVTSNTTNGTYGINNAIDVVVTFSAAVTSTGDVTVTFETGTTDRTCTFTVTASTTGTCNYIIQAGDISADLNVNTIAGTIQNAGLEAMVNFTPATNLSTNKALVIDTVPATISSISSTKTNGTYNTGDVIDINVTFSKAVTADWNTRVNSGSRGWFSVASSSDGTKLAAVASGNYIYTSIDSGVSWVQRTSDATRSWQSITSSADGTKLAAVGNGTYIYTSTDSGATWVQKTSDATRQWYSITSSADGTKLAAVVNGGYIYTSVDSGATWVQKTSDTTRDWRSITSSADGTKLAAVVYMDYIYTSDDSGNTWVVRGNSSKWRSITSSADGTKLAAVVSSGYGYIYTSTDSGVTWMQRTSDTGRDWYSITSSSDGTKLAAVVNNGNMYTSTDSGNTWVLESAGSRSWYYISSSSDGSKLVAGYSGYVFTKGTLSSTILTLETGTTDQTCILTASSSTTATCNYTVQPGDTSADLTVNSIVGNYYDASGNTTTNFSIPTNLDANKALVIDTSLPTITDISSVKSDGTYTVGDVIDINLTFSKTINTDFSSNKLTGTAYWSSIASSADGTKLAAVVSGGYIYRSIDSGATWVILTAGSGAWNSITSSSDGTKLAAVVSGGYIYTSTDSGATWTQRIDAGSRQWYSITSSADGTKLAAVVGSGYIYTSVDSGATWTQTDSSRNWRYITSSSDGTKLAMVNYNDYIYAGTPNSVLLTLETGDVDRTCTFIVTSSTTGTCNYTIQSGDTSSDLNVKSVSGIFSGLGGEIMSNFTPAVNLADNKALVIVTTGPAVSAVSASAITDTTATITWTTDEASSSMVQYGTDTSYGTTTTEIDTPTGVTSHSVDLSSLTACTVYHFKAESINSLTLLGASLDTTFTTSSCPVARRSSGGGGYYTPVNILPVTTIQITYNFGPTTLKNGSKGEGVKELQRFLNKTLNLGLIIDGKLGPKTILVVKKWQKVNGLTPDGLVGMNTKKKMNASVQ